MGTTLASDFKITEHSLVKEWALPVTELANARRGHLREGVHWEWRETRVWYSPSGVEELRRYVIPKPKEDILREKENRRQEEMARHLPLGVRLSDYIVAVERIFPNPRLMRCVDAVGNKMTVRVLSNQKFRRGMRINLKTQCHWLGAAAPGSLEVYEFLDRPPRLPGRW